MAKFRLQNETKEARRLAVLLEEAANTARARRVPAPAPAYFRDPAAEHDKATEDKYDGMREGD